MVKLNIKKFILINFLLISNFFLYCSESKNLKLSISQKAQKVLTKDLNLYAQIKAYYGLPHEFTADNKKLIFSSEDKLLQVLDLDKNEILFSHTREEAIDCVDQVAGPINNNFAYCYNNQINLINLLDFTNIDISVFIQDMKSKSIIALSPEYFAIICASNILRILNLTNNSHIAIENGHVSGFLNLIEFSNNGKYLAACSDYNSINIWKIQSKEAGKLVVSRIANLTGHEKSINYLKFSNNNNCLVSASCDGIIKIWNLITKTCLINYDSHKIYKDNKIGLYITDLVFSKYFENCLFACLNTGAILKFDLNADRIKYKNSLTDYPAKFSIISPDGNYAASILSDNKTISILELNNLEKIAETTLNSYIYKIKFSQDGTFIACSTADRIYVYKIS